MVRIAENTKKLEEKSNVEESKKAEEEFLLNHVQEKRIRKNLVLNEPSPSAA